MPIGMGSISIHCVTFILWWLLSATVWSDCSNLSWIVSVLPGICDPPDLPPACDPLEREGTPTDCYQWSQHPPWVSRGRTWNMSMWCICIMFTGLLRTNNSVDLLTFHLPANNSLMGCNHIWLPYVVLVPHSTVQQLGCSLLVKLAASHCNPLDRLYISKRSAPYRPTNMARAASWCSSLFTLQCWSGQHCGAPYSCDQEYMHNVINVEGREVMCKAHTKD